MSKIFIAFAILSATFLGTACSSYGASPQAAGGSLAQPVNPVVQWNRNLLVIVRTPGAQPPTVHPTRSFAIMHAAIYDAINAIDRTHQPYLVRLDGVPRSASQDAAAAAAAHQVLVALYPAFKTALDAELQQSLAQIPDGHDKVEGIRIGQTVAVRVLALRTNDGSNAQPIPYIFGTAPGDYQSTPPNLPPQPQFTHWSQISQTLSLANNLTTPQSARLFALLNLSFVDDVIAFYDAKYTYNLWRPVTAIRAGDSDNNPETAADPNWLPEVGKTAADPSYPGAHAVISAAGAEVLISFFERDRFEFNVTSEVLPGIERSFTSFSSAAEEATLSRIFAGQHFRFDLVVGQRLGRDVADFVLDNFLTSVHREDESDGR